MPQDALRIGVVATSRPPVSHWGTRTLRPTAVLADIPALAPGTRMTEMGEVWTVYLGDFGLRLHSGDTGHYIDNLRARQPSVWVLMDGAKVQLVTVDPYEGEALAGDPDRLVDAVPMPPALMARVEAFVAAHHVHEVFEKRRRTPAPGPDDPRPPRILREEDKWVQSRGKAGSRRDGGGGAG